MIITMTGAACRKPDRMTTGTMTEMMTGTMIEMTIGTMIEMMTGTMTGTMTGMTIGMTINERSFWDGGFLFLRPFLW